MPEKVTSLNGLKVTSEYWSYRASTTSVRITKIMLNVEINDMIINMLRRRQSLPHSSNQSWKFKEQSPLMSL